MTVQYIKRAEPVGEAASDQSRQTVAEMIATIRRSGESAIREYSRDLDGWSPPTFVVEPDVIEAAGERLAPTDREAIDFAAKQITAFAEYQRAALQEFEREIRPGVIVGQRQVPVQAAGCYVPGGRFAHVSSALMTVATARVAGVGNVIACAPPRGAEGIHPATLYAMRIAGVNKVLCLGGVQAIAALAFGHFIDRPVDVIVGPGNRFVTEAKRMLFGECGIDLVAGPTEMLLIADDSADPWTVAVDLISQAEHGPESASILVSTSEQVARAVLDAVPGVLQKLSDPAVARRAWESCGEVIVAESREEAAAVADDYASEHVEVHARELDWWLANLRNYGSLFLGPETTVAYGDKACGPNHVLPTGRAARYTGGLSVATFTKTLTYERLNSAGSIAIGQAAAQISRLEGMEGHALAADLRVERFAAAAQPA